MADYPDSVLSTLQQTIASMSSLDRSDVTVSQPKPSAAGASVLITALVAIPSFIPSKEYIEFLDAVRLDAFGVPVEKATYRKFVQPEPLPPPPPPPPSASESASGRDPVIVVFIVIGSLIVTCWCAFVAINVFCIPTSRLAQMHEAGKAGVAEFKAGRILIVPVGGETHSETGSDTSE